MDIDTSPLKRCSSAPIIPNTATRVGHQNAAAGSANSPISSSAGSPASSLRCLRNDDPAKSTDTPPAPNIFSRTRRYSSGSFSPLAVANNNNNSTATTNATTVTALNGTPSPAAASAGPRLTPRVSQLRKEECADISNTREVSHERGLHNQLQISQSWEDLTIVTESWSCRDDLSTNAMLNCSSPSPTSSRHHQLAQQQPLPQHASYGTIRLPFGMSPSPTRKTFTTRRSMSPNHVRPSQLCPVKRKFDMDDSCGGGSPPPHKKMFLDVVARGSSPLHSLSMCASPDSGTYEGRTTPKLFVSKLCSSNSLSSFSSASASPTSQLEGMGDGGGGGVTGVDKGVLNTNTNSNSSATASEESGGRTAAGVGAAAAEAKEETKDGELVDHPMLDVSTEVNCDTENGQVAVMGIRDKEGVIMARKHVEVDDGIGEDMSGPIEGATKETEPVPVI